LPNSHITIDTIHQTQSKCFEYVYTTAGNGHSEIHENWLEDPGIIDTKSDQMNKNEKQ